MRTYPEGVVVDDIKALKKSMSPSDKGWSEGFAHSSGALTLTSAAASREDVAPERCTTGSDMKQENRGPQQPPLYTPCGTTFQPRPN